MGMGSPSEPGSNPLPTTKRAAGDSVATRPSLVRRLADPDDHRSWEEFHARYSRLIRNVARSAGLSDAEASEALQETLISVARKMPGFTYEPGAIPSRAGSSTSPATALPINSGVAGPAGSAEHLPDRDHQAPANDPAVPPELEALWDAEWKQALSDAALERVRERVRPEHYEIFHLAVIRQQPPRVVARALGVSLPRVYLAKHRVSRVLAEVVREVRAEWEA